MPPIILLLALLCSSSAGAAELELEGAPLFAKSVTTSAGALGVRLRLGLDLGGLVPSIDAFGASAGSDVARHQGQEGGLTMWGVAAGLRYHTPGRHQFVVGLGAGWGQLVSTQEAGGDLLTYRGEAAPYVEAALGYRYSFDRYWLGLEIGLHAFNHIRYLTDEPGPGPLNATSYVASLGFTLGLRSPSLW